MSGILGSTPTTEDSLPIPVSKPPEEPPLSVTVGDGLLILSLCLAAALLWRLPRRPIAGILCLGSGLAIALTSTTIADRGGDAPAWLIEALQGGKGAFIGGLLVIFGVCQLLALTISRKI